MSDTLRRLHKAANNNAWYALQNAAEEIDALAAENARLRALVEQVEWVYTGETTWVCPWCNGEKYAGGHAADCPRQAALGEGE